MKIYTADFECSTPSPRKFWAPPHSDAAIGVRITRNGEDAGTPVLAPDGGSPLEAEADKVNGYTVFKVNTGATGSVRYSVTASGLGQSFGLTQVVTDSTVFEVNAGGGSGPVGDYATQAWVEGKLTAYATTEDLAGYATQDYVGQQVSAKADAADLTAYATKQELTAYATEEYVGQQVSSKADSSALTAYATKQDLAAYATEEYVEQEVSSKADSSALTAYATKQELAAYATEEYVEQEVSAKADASALTAYAAKADVDACVKLSAQSVQAVSGDLSARTVLAPAYMLSSASYGQSRPYDPQTDGVWEEQEDPDTGEIIRTWVPDDPDSMEDPASKGYWRYYNPDTDEETWMKSYGDKDLWDQIKGGNESEQKGLGQYVVDTAASYVSSKVSFDAADSVQTQRIRAVYEDDWAYISADQDSNTLYVVLSGSNPDSNPDSDLGE